MQGTKEPQPELSVVLTVRDTEETIGRDVRRIAEHLRASGRSFEILALNDGCRDNSMGVLRLLAADVPELHLGLKNVAGNGFVRGAAEARGEWVLLVDARAPVPLAALGWALGRLQAGTDAVILRGRCIVAHRLRCLSALIRAVGRGESFETSFERHATGLSVQIIGTLTRRHIGLLEPVLRFLAA
jgi:hypothetical protein